MKVPSGIAVAVMLALSGLTVRDARAQVELDRVLSRVGNQVITQLDVRRARMLKLVPDSATTDADVQRELENHWLMVAEVARFSPAQPNQAALDAERDRWRSAFGPGVDPASLYEPAGMNQAEVDAWLRDEVKIQAYLQSRFGNLPAGERPAAVASWIRSLRERAGLR